MLEKKTRRANMKINTIGILNILGQFPTIVKSLAGLNILFLSLLIPTAEGIEKKYFRKVPESEYVFIQRMNNNRPVPNPMKNTPS
jgi:hypothetical protein